jgi:uncharacterized protein (DUF433 family)
MSSSNLVTPDLGQSQELDDPRTQVVSISGTGAFSDVLGVAKSGVFRVSRSGVFGVGKSTVFGVASKESKGSVHIWRKVQPDAEQIGSTYDYLLKRLGRSSTEIQRAVQIDPRVMHGNPVFAGSRIPLYQIIEELADPATISKLREGYPSLTETQIMAGLDFVSSLLRIHDDDKAIDRRKR